MTFITKQSEKHVQANDRCTSKRSVTLQISFCIVMLTHFITWAGRRLAQFIKYLRFSFRGYSWLFVMGLWHPTLQILNLDSISDQYLLGKCMVPPRIFMSKMNAISYWLSNPEGTPGNSWQGCVVRLSKSGPYILFQINTYKAIAREYSPGDLRCHDDEHYQL